MTVVTRPRLGFLGLGWIGRHRLQAVVEAGAAEVAAVADPAVEELDGVAVLDSLDELLAEELDGIVIATPSALHAEQATRALEHGLAVFCQKPLARSETEVRRVVDAARASDRLLSVDLSYRHVEGIRLIRELIRAGELGEVFAADLVFHNAYGPDKAWFYDPALAGGGCVMDLGTHLVDLALWVLDWPDVAGVESRVRRAGGVEDFAVARVDLAGGAVVRIACSWNLHAGRDAVIEAAFYGDGGGAAIRNVGGSFFDFVAERYLGTETRTLAEPPDEWGGRAIVQWARRIAAGERFDPDAERLVQVARVLDEIYRAAR